jgi:hypothetical protein
LFRHRETLITVIIIIFCILVGIIWNVRLCVTTMLVESHLFFKDFESQKIQDKKKASLANAARPAALAAQVNLLRVVHDGTFISLFFRLSYKEKMRRRNRRGTIALDVGFVKV